MACLLKVLSDMLQSPQPLSHIHICPKPKVKLGPTESFYPAPPSSLDIATARNPNQFGLTEIGKLCVMVSFCVEAIYTPPPTLHSWREPSEQTYTSNLPVLRENYLLMC